MQCVRGNNDSSPPLTPIQSSVSMGSLNEYFSKRFNRKSFMRRSFEIFRKNVVRRSSSFLPRKNSKARKIWKRSGLNVIDLNNNRNGFDNSQISVQTIDQHSSANTYCNGDGDILVISTDSVILSSNKPNASRKQFYTNKR